MTAAKSKAGVGAVAADVVEAEALPQVTVTVGGSEWTFEQVYPSVGYTLAVEWAARTP